MQKPIPDDAILIPDEASKVFSGEIFDVYQWPQQLFDGSSHNFEMLKRADTVTAICIVDDQLLIIEDEQPHLGKRISWPGGRVDATDSNLEQAIKREIKEETGYSFKNWRLIKVSQPYRKIEWFVYVYLAWDEQDSAEAHLDPGEKIKLTKMDFNGVKELVMKRTDYLSESQDIFEKIASTQELLSLAEYTGQIIDR